MAQRMNRVWFVDSKLNLQPTYYVGACICSIVTHHPFMPKLRNETSICAHEISFSSIKTSSIIPGALSQVPHRVNRFYHRVNILYCFIYIYMTHTVEILGCVF